MLDPGGIFVESASISAPGLFVKVQFQASVGFGVLQFQFTRPRRYPVFVRPKLNEHQLVPEVRQVLQRAITAFIVEEIGNDNDEASLRAAGDELADDMLVTGASPHLQLAQRVRDADESMAPPAGDKPARQLFREGVDLD